MSRALTTNYLTIGKFLSFTIGSKPLNVYAQIPLKCCCINNKRTLFNFSSGSNRKKSHNGRKLVGYSMEQLYSVVSDVENYYKFVPWCKKSLVAYRNPTDLKAELVIGFPPINERYTSHVTLVRPHMVRAECTDGRLFHHLQTIWRFSPGLRNYPNSCVIDFQITFEFRSVFHSNLANLFFDQVLLQMEGAFITETGKRYGKPCIPMQIIETNAVKS